MADHEGVVTGTLRFQGQANDLGGAAQLRQRMEVTIGRVEPMDLEVHAGRSGFIQQCLQSLHVGGLFHRVDKTLVPDPPWPRAIAHLPLHSSITGPVVPNTGSLSGRGTAATERRATSQSTCPGRFWSNHPLHG